MCGRYYVADEESTIELRMVIAEANRRLAGVQIPPSGDFAPGGFAAVIANSRSMLPKAFAMHWGYALDNVKLMINARSETAQEKRMFADGMAQRRCVIPASGYYEWEKRGTEKVRYAIRPRGEETAYLAGIYRLEEGKASFVILTRAPAANIAFIHDRMPVLLAKEQIRDWLNPEIPTNEILKNALTDVEFAAV